MLLQNKNALIFGGGGHIGSGVARVMAREGASVYLSGPHLAPVKKVADEIRAAGGRAEASELDALDEPGVNAYVDRVAKQAGRVDVVFNAMGVSGEEAVGPSVDISIEKFMKYMQAMVPSQFLTARVAARHMAAQRSGVVVFLGATPALGVAPLIAGASAAHAAIEGLTRSLATEWSPLGIRVVCIRPNGMTDTRRIQGVLSAMGKLVGMPPEAMIQGAAEKTLLKRMPTVPETSEVIAFLASDRASTMTGAIVNASCGEVLD